MTDLDTVIVPVLRADTIHLSRYLDFLDLIENRVYAWSVNHAARLSVTLLPGATQRIFWEAADCALEPDAALALHALDLDL